MKPPWPYNGKEQGRGQLGLSTPVKTILQLSRSCQLASFFVKNMERLTPLKKGGELASTRGKHQLIPGNHVTRYPNESTTGPFSPVQNIIERTAIPNIPSGPLFKPAVHRPTSLLSTREFSFPYSMATFRRTVDCEGVHAAQKPQRMSERTLISTIRSRVF